MILSEMTKYIVSVPNINGGMATIAGTRVTVAEIIDHLEAESTVASVVNDLKKADVIVTREEVLAALEFAKHKTAKQSSTSYRSLDEEPNISSKSK